MLNAYRGGQQHPRDAPPDRAFIILSFIHASALSRHARGPGAMAIDLGEQSGIDPEMIGEELNAIGKASLRRTKCRCAGCGRRRTRNDQLGVGINRRPRPHVASAWALANLTFLLLA
jgi:hypothetical protein